MAGGGAAAAAAWRQPAFHYRIICLQLATTAAAGASLVSVLHQISSMQSNCLQDATSASPSNLLVLQLPVPVLLHFHCEADMLQKAVVEGACHTAAHAASAGLVHSHSCLAMGSSVRNTSR
jgi:hypothetical protein